MKFATPVQERLFHAVIRELERIGYNADLLKKDYEFPDWFTDGTPTRHIPAAAFGQTPHSYATACLGIVLTNGTKETVNDYRALGAPILLEISSDSVAEWVAGSSPSGTRLRQRWGLDELSEFFLEREIAWAGQTLLRAKNVGLRPGPRQLDLFVDTGLIPALEEEIKTRLDYALKDSLAIAKAVYMHDVGRAPDLAQFFRLAFRFLAAKVLHDRKIPDFAAIDASSPETLLRMVEEYYGDRSPALDHLPTQQAIAASLWNQVSFAHLSVEALAYIYENTFVTNEDRERAGIHGTPYSVARYLTYNIPFEDIPLSAMSVVEPCCGHGVFLVAALQRLRELLPTNSTPEERHKYFVRSLSGFDEDDFSLEVARLCLMLADFPGHNGWNLLKRDVFTAPDFKDAISRAQIVLCNPPFEDFAVGDPRRRLGLSARKPAALLQIILNELPERSLLGFVLPRAFLEGLSYRSLRRQLVQRYDEIQLIALPDKIFSTSGVESSLLICQHPRIDHRPTKIDYIHVADRDCQLFLMDYTHSARRKGLKTPTDAETSLKVYPLTEAWDNLQESDKLAVAARRITRGVEYFSPFDRGKNVSSIERPGFVPGVLSAEGMLSFLSPDREYLSVRPEGKKREAPFDLPWHQPKVLVNKARLSRYPWCIAAYPDESGLMAYQNFIAIWPRQEKGWTVRGIAAVLNGPLASAFVDARENKMDVRINTIRNVPLPTLDADEKKKLEDLVGDFEKVILHLEPSQHHYAKGILLEIDSLVLQGYRLPGSIEFRLLDMFRKHRRPVPFDFEDYVELMIERRFEDRGQFLNENEEEQQRTLESLQKILDEDRLAGRKFVS